jgi:hypothetical protein
MADEYRIDLEERHDKYQKIYLFGSLRMFNSVMFIRQDKDGAWHATIKPYTGPANGVKDVDRKDPDHDDPWFEEKRNSSARNR